MHQIWCILRNRQMYKLYSYDTCHCDDCSSHAPALSTSLQGRRASERPSGRSVGSTMRTVSRPPDDGVGDVVGAATQHGPGRPHALPSGAALDCVAATTTFVTPSPWPWSPPPLRLLGPWALLPCDQNAEPPETRPCNERAGGASTGHRSSDACTGQ